MLTCTTTLMLVTVVTPVALAGGVSTTSTVPVLLTGVPGTSL